MFLILILYTCQGIQASVITPQVQDDTIIRERLDSFRLSMQNKSPAAAYYYELVQEYLNSGKVKDSMLISDMYYYTGTYNYIGHSYAEAISLLEKSVRYRLEAGCTDDVYYKARANLGLSYMYEGINEKARENLETALRLREATYGKDSPALLRTLLNLSAVYTEMNMSGKALSASLRGIQIAEKSATGQVDSETVLKLYYNASVAYKEQLDFSRARRNSEIALSFVSTGTTDKSIILKIYNSLAVTNVQLGNREEADSYFQNALEMIASEDFTGRTVGAVYENYAFYLLEDSIYDRAGNYLLMSVEDARMQYGKGSRDHVLNLLSYSFFLLEHIKDYEKAEGVLSEIVPYTEANYQDSRVKAETYLYLSKLMYETGRISESLDYVNKVLDDSLNISSSYMVRILVQKSRALHKMYDKGGGIKELEGSLSAVQEAIGIIERTRLEIREDESRNRISGRFKDVYDKGMSVLYELYKLTGDRAYRERSLIISEKSKAAGLLAATRNNRSMNFRLPQELAEMEKQLLSDIRDYNEVVYTELVKPEPDPEVIDHYKLLSFKSSTCYDSLVQVFKEDYPRYYNLKYNTGVSSSDDIKREIGRSCDFIEYYMSDSLLYINLVNDDTSLFEKVALPDNFREKILGLRNILLNPAINGGARAQYNDYLSLSYDLYKMFILPVKDHLISDRLVISPDGLLYYIPFETLIASVPDSDEINYRGLDYLLNEYEIVYEYSGTLMTETPSPKTGIRNSVVSFAPDYSEGMDVDDIMKTRQSGRDMLNNIPGAREEAVFINKLIGGKLYMDSQATESSFKRNAVDSDIVHMAMHTLLNDTDPMYSRMVFSTEPEAAEDGMLNTYEVYNLDLNAKMVFLSSCNTGSGYLQSGEGVMSLARGFFYSGSPCVIMSLWEVDDRSGSAIVKDFYRNIRKGLSKSHSLRKARMEYLKEADQMRSHPYFWGTLVIMGDDSPIYSNFHKYIIGLVLIFALLFFLIKKYHYKSGSA